MSQNNESSVITVQNTNEEEIIENVRHLWNMLQSIQITKYLFQVEEIEIEHTPEEAQIAYDKLNAIPLGTRVDVNA